MSKGTNQKLKLIYLIKIMLEKKELFEQFDICIYEEKLWHVWWRRAVRQA